MTTVSIITPSFNQAAYLEQTILSVLNQDHPDIEYILVDGASTDTSLEIIKKYEDRLAYWVSEKDHGQAEAINKGFVRARGDVIAWLNSDDHYLPGAVASAAKVFEQHPDVVLAYADMLAVNEHDHVFNTMNYKQLAVEDLLCFEIIGQPSVFMRRSALHSVGNLDTTFHFLLDHHLWIRFAQLGRILHVHQTWSAARYHPEAKNRARALEFGKEAYRILEWVREDAVLAPILARVERRATASAHRINARYLLDGGRPAAALVAWTRALLIDPRVALARLNILASSVLNLLGLGPLRQKVLDRRRADYR
jgi:glycosyltransferase involved in cell wall biosynthesis